MRAAGQQTTGVREHDRVVVHVDDESLRGDRLGDRVGVTRGRDAGADVQELPDPLIGGQVAHRAGQEGPGRADRCHQAGEDGHCFLTRAAVGGEVVPPAEPVVLDPGDVGHAGIDPDWWRARTGCGVAPLVACHGCASRTLSPAQHRARAREPGPRLLRRKTELMRPSIPGTSRAPEPGTGPRTGSAGSPDSARYATCRTDAITSRWSPAGHSLGDLALQRRQPAVRDQRTGVGPALVRDAVQHQPRPGPSRDGEPARQRPLAPAARIVTANQSSRPAVRGVGISAAAQTRTSGGSRDTGQNALTVVPTSSRPSATVTSVTPLAKWTGRRQPSPGVSRGHRSPRHPKPPSLDSPASPDSPAHRIARRHRISQRPGSISGPWGTAPRRRPAGRPDPSSPRTTPRRLAAAAGRASLESGGRNRSSGVGWGTRAPPRTCGSEAFCLAAASAVSRPPSSSTRPMPGGVGPGPHPAPGDLVHLVRLRPARPRPCR